MKVGIIGRSEFTFDTMTILEEQGHEIKFIVTAKEAPEYKYTSSDFERFAAERKIPFLHSPKVTASDVKKLLGEEFVDICISVNYSGIIPQDIIELFKHGVLNAHGGDLPKYRGNACQAWAIINGEDRIGLCIHKMIGGELDSGPIISRSYYPLNLKTKIGDVYEWMIDNVPNLMLEAVEKLSEEPSYILKEQSKDPADALRCYPRKPEDGRIDWTKSDEEIVRLINASSEPYAGAFCYLEENKIRIWDAEIDTKPPYNYLAIPGQILQFTDTECIVATGSGKIIIKNAIVEKEASEVNLLNFIVSVRQRLK